MSRKHHPNPFALARRQTGRRVLARSRPGWRVEVDERIRLMGHVYKPPVSLSLSLQRCLWLPLLDYPGPSSSPVKVAGPVKNLVPSLPAYGDPGGSLAFPSLPTDEEHSDMDLGAWVFALVAKFLTTTPRPCVVVARAITVPPHSMRKSPQSPRNLILPRKSIYCAPRYTALSPLLVCTFSSPGQPSSDSGRWKTKPYHVLQY